jgi:hypothetical protein
MVMFDHLGDFYRLVEDEAPRQSRDREISPPFVIFLGFRAYVTGMVCRPMGLPMFRPIL